MGAGHVHFNASRMWTGRETCFSSVACSDITVENHWRPRNFPEDHLNKTFFLKTGNKQVSEILLKSDIWPFFLSLSFSFYSSEPLQKHVMSAGESALIYLTEIDMCWLLCCFSGKPIFSVDIHPDGTKFATGGQGKACSSNGSCE